MKKSTRIVKRLIALSLVLLLCIESFAAVVGDNDGAAFITKAEFDSMKNDFQSQLDTYNSSIDNKIDGTIANYLAGISSNHYWELYCRNSAAANIQMATKRTTTKWAHAHTSSIYTQWLQLPSCVFDAIIANVRIVVAYEWPDTHTSTTNTATRNWGLSVIKWHDENLERNASIIWSEKLEYKFEVLDEDLGFGNQISDYSDDVPATSLMTRWSFKSIGNLFVKNTTDQTITLDTITDDMTGYAGNDTNYDSTLSNATIYCDNNIWPGRHFASDYITNWNQLYQPLWGEAYTDDGSYLKLIDGFPLVSANPDERLEYEIEFDENDTFEIIAKTSPFGNTIDEDDLINISSDNVNFGKSCRINKTGTIYFDFANKDRLNEKATVIFIKWHKVNSTNNYNGGGTLNLTNHRTVKVTI